MSSLIASTGRHPFMAQWQTSHHQSLLCLLYEGCYCWSGVVIPESRRTPQDTYQDIDTDRFSGVQQPMWEWGKHTQCLKNTSRQVEARCLSIAGMLLWLSPGMVMIRTWLGEGKAFESLDSIELSNLHGVNPHLHTSSITRHSHRNIYKPLAPLPAINHSLSLTTLPAWRDLASLYFVSEYKSVHLGHVHVAYISICNYLVTRSMSWLFQRLWSIANPWDRKYTDAHWTLHHLLQVLSR